MPIYVTLVKWTDQGIKGVKGSASRMDASKELLRAVGGSIKENYMVMGEYDLVRIVEAPSRRGLRERNTAYRGSR